MSLLGALEAQSGFHEIGLERSEEAVGKAPRNPDILTNHGAILTAQGFITDALPYFRKALELQPQSRDTHIKLANAQMIGEKFDEAEATLHEFIRIFPQEFSGPSLLAEVLNRANKPIEAMDTCRQLIEQDPSIISIQVQYVELLIAAGEIDRALTYIDDLIETQSAIITETVLLTRIDLVSITQGPDAALDLLAEILKSRPGVQRVYRHWRTMLLRSGYFEEGWRALAKEPGRMEKIRQLPHRVWQGTDIKDRTLLIRGAEGIGEQLMYSQLFPKAQEKTKNLIVECDERLLSVFSRNYPEIKFVRWTTPPEDRLSDADIDLQCVPRDLAGMFLNSYDEFPATRKKLAAHPYGIAAAQDLRMRFPGKRLVGISWRSSSSTGGGRKSIPLIHWGDIVKESGIQFVNLQYGSTDSEIELLKEAYGIEIVQAPGIDLTSDIDQCIGLVSGLDLVITVDLRPNLPPVCGESLGLN
jgi:tetratricopeptide (TPR) repeat protein